MKSLESLSGFTFDKKRQGIYTTLDTLYDTRLAVIEEVDKVLALTSIMNGWHDRVYDKIEEIPQDKYNELYDNRDVNTLVLASPTFIAETIRAWIGHARVSMNGTPFSGYCELFVNVWPYRLTKEQGLEYSSKLQESMGETTKITMININPKYITAMDAKIFFSVMFDTDWYYWLEERAKSNDIKITPLPNVALHAPKLFRGIVSDGIREQVRGVDVFTNVEEKLKPIIGIEFLDTSFFTTVITPDLAKSLLEKHLIS